MSPDGSVTAHEVWKRFRSDRNRNLLRDEISRIRRRIRGNDDSSWRWALRDISFEVAPGDSLALIGANGSGKSTMLKLLAGVMFPTYGDVKVHGRIGALIEVRAGIHPDLSGRENVYMFGSLLGLKRHEIRSRFDQIVEFSDLAEAIDRQVKFYSSGMSMRLGFAVAAFLEPDVLVVDEVLAVGDATFQQRCLERMREVMANGTTLLYVSHDLATVEAMCRQAVWLDRGVSRATGETREVIGNYRRAVEELARSFRETHQSVVLDAVTVDDGTGGPVRSNGPVRLSMHVASDEPRQIRLVLGVSEGSASPVFVVEYECHAGPVASRVECRIEHLPLPSGDFAVWATALDAAGRVIRAWTPIADFSVDGLRLPAAPTGVVRLSPVAVESTWHETT